MTEKNTSGEGQSLSISDKQATRSIPLTAFAGKKIWIATPMYGGNANGNYMASVIGAISYFNSIGVSVHFDAIFKESLITRARNYMVDRFLRSDYDYLLFIDSDVSFSHTVPATLLAVNMEDPKKTIVTAPYPKKSIAWEKVHKAAASGIPAAELHKYVGDFVVNLNLKAGEKINLGAPFVVGEAGTGMMLIHRSVFNDIRLSHPEFLFKPDHIRDPDFDGSRMVMAYFDTMIDPDTKRYLSEDYMFCKIAAKCGHKTWLCAWLNLTHHGSYEFTGNLIDVIKSGSHLTFDKNNGKKVD